MSALDPLNPILEVRLAPPSPRNGNRLPVGVHPGHTGGKKGRSGRKSDEFKRLVKEIRNEQELRVVRQILDKKRVYATRGVCSRCGKHQIIRELKQSAREQLWLREAKAILGQVRRIMRTGKPPRASESPTKESERPLMSAT